MRWLFKCCLVQQVYYEMEILGLGICLDVLDLGLMRYEVDGMKQVEVFGSGEVNVESKEWEMMFVDVRRIVVDLLLEVVDVVY